VCVCVYVCVCVCVCVCVLVYMLVCALLSVCVSSMLSSTDGTYYTALHPTHMSLDYCTQHSNDINWKLLPNCLCRLGSSPILIR